MKRALITALILLMFILGIMAVKHYKPVVDRSACVGCADCVRICPVKAVTIVEEKAEIADSLCIDCRQCVKTCPHNAIRTPQ